MRLIIASNNKNKIREIKEILGDKFEEIVSMREAGIELDVEEDADSFIGNARKKRRKQRNFARRMPCLRMIRPLCRCSERRTGSVFGKIRRGGA